MAYIDGLREAMDGLISMWFTNSWMKSGTERRVDNVYSFNQNCDGTNLKLGVLIRILYTGNLGYIRTVCKKKLFII